MTDTYKALIANNDPEFSVSYQQIGEQELGEGDVTVAVEYSTLNFKDGLAMTNASPIVQKFPLIMGVDFSGTVVESDHAGFQAGDKVVMNGYGCSENRNGGYTERARINGDLLVALPESLTSRQAMAIGTAGYTAMLSVMALEEGGMTPDRGEVLVTGAAGGVGTVAVVLLAGLGYRVVASTGRMEETEFLTSLGAAEVIDRQTLSEPGKPMQRERWAGVVDCVGSKTLANVVAQTQYGGVVTACGLAQGADLPLTVLPFILRNVQLQGVDSVHAPMARRQEAWRRLASELDIARLESLSFDLPFSEVLDSAPKILAGQIRGRAIVDMGQ
ncbi:MAG: oxidoreductase [Halieaceae bacterium]|jgi:acrylyl-CoA reductase (NADPH)|nr:oxidoreductase [Halieaceae bacterium]